MVIPVKSISELEEKSEVSVNDKILILDSVSEEARLASKDELKGDPWTPWQDWEDGAAATITVWSTTTGTPWSSASVTNSWTSSAAVLDFTIPQWAKWEPWVDGEDGAAATITVWTTTTLPSWSSATVTNVWTSQDAILNFWIPKWDTWPWSWDVLWPSNSTDWNIVIFNWASWKAIKDSWKTVAWLESGISANTTAISTINWKIPSAATTSNQLADKNYVDDSINSVTAYYITKNAQGDQWATRAELFAATTFYSWWVVRVPTKNDYTIVLDDENHDHATTRYIYNNGWEYQYTVNETALTQAQLNALNSWITSAKVTIYDGYATGKQDTLSWWNNWDVLTNVNWTPTWQAPSGLPAWWTNGQIIMMVNGVATWVNPADVWFRLQASDTEIDVPYVWSGTEAQYAARQSYSDDTEYHTV